MAGLLSVPATRGGLWGGRGREGRTGRQGRTRDGGRAKEKRGNGGGAGEAEWRPSTRNSGRPAAARGLPPPRLGRARCPVFPRPPTSADRRAERTGAVRSSLCTTASGRPLQGHPACPPACGRAPVRALWPGPPGGACMGAAWIGPPRCTRGAGGQRRLIPRRRRNRSGGRGPPPGPCVPGGAGVFRRRGAGVRRAGRADGGSVGRITANVD